MLAFVQAIILSGGAESRQIRRPFRRALQYACYDWTREMPTSKHLITWAGILMQGYAIWCTLVDPEFNEDDVTILLVKRGDAASSGRRG